MRIDLDPFQEMCHALTDLMVATGIVGSVMERYPQHVQDNFAERMDRITQYARSEMEAITSFGEAYDS